MSFGEALRGWREHARLTQGQLASELGLDQTTLSTWEKRGTPPRDRKTVARAATILGASYEDLTNGVLPPGSSVYETHPALESEQAGFRQEEVFTDTVKLAYELLDERRYSGMDTRAILQVVLHAEQLRAQRIIGRISILAHMAVAGFDIPDIEVMAQRWDGYSKARQLSIARSVLIAEESTLRMTPSASSNALLVAPNADEAPIEAENDQGVARRHTA